MGDFVANFHRPETGIQTVEGNVAGSRAALLSRKREREQLEFETRAAKLRQDALRDRKGEFQLTFQITFLWFLAVDCLYLTHTPIRRSLQPPTPSFFFSPLFFLGGGNLCRYG
jgi:hypothetical protein